MMEGVGFTVAGLPPRSGRLRAAAGALILLAAGCGDRVRPGSAPAEPPVVTGVEVAIVAASPREKTAEVVGTVRAATTAAVAPRVMGRITGVLVSEGSRVEKGALLATIEEDALVAQLSAAEGAVVEAQAGREDAERAISQAEANRSLSEKTFERYKALFEEKVVTRQEFEEIEAKRTVAVKDHERALERRSQAAARVVQARAGADAARATAAHAKVTAPFSGIVTEKKTEAGSMAVPGVPLFVLEGAGRYRIEAAVPETYLGIVKAGTRVQVILDPAPGKAIPSIVSEVTPVVDPTSRTFIAKADLRASGLRSGMFGRIRFGTGRAAVLAVPRGAISRVGGSDAVFAVTVDNVARLVMVTTGERSGDSVEILSGIGPGARIAVSRLDKLVDGARVEVRK